MRDNLTALPFFSPKKKSIEVKGPLKYLIGIPFLMMTCLICGAIGVELIRAAIPSILPIGLLVFVLVLVRTVSSVYMKLSPHVRARIKTLVIVLALGSGALAIVWIVLDTVERDRQYQELTRKQTTVFMTIDLTLADYTWTRNLAIEEFKTVRETSTNTVPPSSTSEVSSQQSCYDTTDSNDNTISVCDTINTYSINLWVTLKTLTTSGRSLDELTWPPFAPEKIEGLGAQRIGKKTAEYHIIFRDRTEHPYEYPVITSEDTFETIRKNQHY